jgi:SET domain-containing protein
LTFGEAAGLLKSIDLDRRPGGLMFLVRVDLKPSGIHGLGCFAAEPIRKGQLIWEFDPRIDILIPLAEYDNFPAAVREILDRWTYVEERAGEKVMILCGDHAKFMNHSDKPNVYDSEDNQREYALWDIQVGEELTCNYFEFDKHAEAKFNNLVLPSKKGENEE